MGRFALSLEDEYIKYKTCKTTPRYISHTTKYTLTWHLGHFKRIIGTCTGGPMMKKAKQDFQHWFFMEAFIIATRHIWKQRNNLIFEGKRPTVRGWFSNFTGEARLQAHRIKEDKRQTFLSWVDSVHLVVVSWDCREIMEACSPSLRRL